MDEKMSNFIKILSVVLTFIGSWIVARYTAKMDNKKNLESMQAEMEKINTSNKYENRRIMNQLILENGAELCELIVEMMREEIFVGIRAVYSYYRTNDPELKEKARKKALDDIYRSGDMLSTRQRRCSILFSYFPELKKDFKNLMGKYNDIKLLELYYQENKLKNLDNEYSERAMNGDKYIATINSYDKQFYELIDRLDNELTKVTVEMKNL